MKAHLMFRDQDFRTDGTLPSVEQDLTQDLGLATLYEAMSRGDEFLAEVARYGVLSQLTDPDAIAYRQQVLRDAIGAPDVVRQMYDIAVDAIEQEHKVWIGIFSKYPATILHRSIEVLAMFVERLRSLREIADSSGDRFASSGFRSFFAMLADQLSDTYFEEVSAHLRTLKFRAGICMSADLGVGNKGENYVLRAPPEQHHWFSDLFAHRSKLSFTIPERDEQGHQALSELRDRGINLVANATAQSADHILSFFVMLRAELGFYLGCVNLYETLYDKGAPVCEPQALPHRDARSRQAATQQAATQFAATGLYDIGLALSTDTPIVGNDLAADGKDLIVVTGANQGGKSTFLRSVGLAFLMMQAGMFVPATGFRAAVRTGVFTHFKREEDSSMRSGKLDEEMARMSEIADGLRLGGLVLFNESFASTNEREGSEISRQIISALTGCGVTVVFVTHMYDLAHGFYRQDRDDILLLRAERHDDGSRPFRLSPGKPLPTSYGPDVYARIFGRSPQPAARETATPRGPSEVPRARDGRGAANEPAPR